MIMQFTAASSSEIKEMVKKLLEAKQAYYGGGKPLLTDRQFDKLEEKLRELSPDNAYFKKVGFSVPKTRPNKARLPAFMGSLSKVKTPSDVIKAVGKTGTVIVSDKLDGLSLMVYNNGKEMKVYTRGNGTVGQDISYLYSHIKGMGTLPKGYIVRGEAIISSKTFSSELSRDFSNARNTVSGIINSNGVSPNIDKVTFVVHGMIKPPKGIEQSAGWLKSHGWLAVPHKQVKASELPLFLPEYLVKRKKLSKYAIDGIVITKGGESVAFKGQDEEAEAVIKEIEWNVSRYGALKPVAILKNPVSLAGAAVSRVTAHNAKYVEDNKLGKGAVISIVRSGEVIPYIKEVLKPARKADMPKTEWEWNESGVDIAVPQEGFQESDSFKVKALTNFLLNIGAKGFKEGMTAKLVSYGIDTPLKLAEADIGELQESGIGAVNSRKLHEALRGALSNVSLPELMAASLKFPKGWGVKRFYSLLSAISYKELLSIAKKQGGKGINRLFETIPGLGAKYAREFSENLLSFEAWRKAFPRSFHLPSSYTVENVEGALTGWKVAFSKVRDKELEALIEENGGEVGSVVRNTTLLVVPSLKETSSKIEKARKDGIKIVTLPTARKLIEKAL